jgi:hypothetical protein
VSDRLFSFRWDIDHRVCITDGLPRISAVCRDFGVPNTFFVNLGRSTNLREWLGKGIARSKAKLADREAVHLIHKTGWPRFVVETALARPVGWSRRFHALPGDELIADVEESYGHFVRHFGAPAGFSSPGFYSDERVMLILDRLAFRYNGDAIGGEPHRATAGGRTLRHWTIPVTLAGPRTIPFLEYHGARGTPEPEVLRLLDEHLESRDEVVLYGHPCYEGVREALLRKVFARVVEHGFRFVTLQTMAERLQAATSAR